MLCVGDGAAQVYKHATGNKINSSDTSQSNNEHISVTGAPHGYVLDSISDSFHFRFSSAGENTTVQSAR